MPNLAISVPLPNDKIPVLQIKQSRCVVVVAQKEQNSY